MLADTGERYLSTPLFADIPADMTEEEKEIAASTPSAAPPGITMPSVTEEALAFVAATNAASPVVVWCAVLPTSLFSLASRWLAHVLHLIQRLVVGASLQVAGVLRVLLDDIWAVQGAQSTVHGRQHRFLPM
jgi:hypothetical protein